MRRFWLSFGTQLAGSIFVTSRPPKAENTFWMLVSTGTMMLVCLSVEDGRYRVEADDGTVLLGPFYSVRDSALMAQQLANLTGQKVTVSGLHVVGDDTPQNPGFVESADASAHSPIPDSAADTARDRHPDGPLGPPNSALTPYRR